MNEQTVLMRLLVGTFPQPVQTARHSPVSRELSGMSGMPQPWLGGPPFWHISELSSFLGRMNKGRRCRSHLWVLRTLWGSLSRLWYNSSSPPPQSLSMFVSQRREWSLKRIFSKLHSAPLYSCICLNLATREGIRCSSQGIRFKNM